jgi:putative aldouronate transport system permease protein
MRNVKPSIASRLQKDLKTNYLVYLMAIPALIWFLVFIYGPYYGLTVAFKDFRPALGIANSEWAGLKYFKSFFNSFYASRVIKNTVLLSSFSLIFGFPVPIIFALLLNELRALRYKRIIQTFTYLPHFISIVVVCGLIRSFCETDGLFNQFLLLLNSNHMPNNLLQAKENFRVIYIASGIWQQFGFSSILYLSALSGINPQLYEAAIIDGAGRFKQTLHITLPGISSMIIVLFILALGRIFTIGWEKVVLLYNDAVMETADVIDSFIYRRGLLEANYSLATAVGLFSQSINITILIISNKIANRISGVGLW